MFCSPFSAAILLRLTFLLQFYFQEKTFQFFLFSVKNGNEVLKKKRISIFSSFIKMSSDVIAFYSEIKKN